MESYFENELYQLKVTVLRMAASTSRAMEKAATALLERRTGPAEEVIAGDREINLLEVEVDNYCLRLLALNRPLGRNLRFVVGCMRIAVDLERTADQAVNIAERAVFLASRPALPANAALAELARTAAQMLRSAITSFANNDVELARGVCRADDGADELNVAVLKHLLDYMVNEAPAVERSVQAIIAARCLERVADQATNIAESVIFITEGIDIRHHCQI